MTVRCGILRVGDVLTHVDGKPVHKSSLEEDERSGPSEQLSSSSPLVRRRLMKRRQRGGEGGEEDKKIVHEILQVRNRLIGQQGTFVWLCFWREGELDARAAAGYLPDFGPHVVVERREGGWAFAVRLLRGSCDYIKAVHSVDWMSERLSRQKKVKLIEMMI